MNLTIAPFSRPVVVVWAQVWVSRIRILWWVRILVRFGRNGPVHGVSGPVRFDQNDPLTRDSGELRQIWLHIRNLRKKLDHIGLVRVGLGFCGPSKGTGPEFRTPGLGRAGPVRNPEPNRNSVHKNPDRPGLTLYDPNFCVDPEYEVRFDVAHRNHELEGHFGQNGPVR